MPVTLSAHALTTAEAVEEELALSSGAGGDRLLRQINYASAAIESYCGRHFERETGIVEDLGSAGDPRLVLSRTPVESITSIAYNGDTIDASNYELADRGSGTVIFPAGTTFTGFFSGGIAGDRVYGYERRLYRVTYVGGYVLPGGAATPPQLALPDDLQLAATLAAATFYLQRGRDRSVTSERLMSYSVSYRTFATDIAALPPEVRAIIDAYKRLAIA